MLISSTHQSLGTRLSLASLPAGHHLPAGGGGGTAGAAVPLYCGLRVGGSGSRVVPQAPRVPAHLPGATLPCPCPNGMLLPATLPCPRRPLMRPSRPSCAPCPHPPATTTTPPLTTPIPTQPHPQPLADVPPAERRRCRYVGRAAGLARAALHCCLPRVHSSLVWPAGQPCPVRSCTYPNTITCQLALHAMHPHPPPPPPLLWMVQRQSSAGCCRGRSFPFESAPLT